MTREDAVQAIVDVLFSAEEDLTDGYQYYVYGGTEKVNDYLRSLARDILDAIGEFIGD